MTTAAVILNWNQSALAERAALSVLHDVDRVYLVDNDSRPNDRARLERFSRDTATFLIRNERNLGYSGGNNAGIRCAIEDGFDAVLVMNNDAAASPGAVKTLAEALYAAPHIGAVAPTVVDATTGLVLHTSCRLDLETGEAGWDDTGVSLKDVDRRPRPTGYVSGEAFLARIAAFAECGYFDPRFFCYYEDVEWSVRVRRAGWALQAVPAAVFDHIGGGSRANVAGAFYRSRNSPLFLRWGLGKSRSGAIRHTAGQQLMRTARHLRRGQIRTALTGTIAGWMSGISMVLRDE